MSLSTPLLLPAPREITLLTGEFVLPVNGQVGMSDRMLLTETQTLCQSVLDYTKLNWSYSVSADAPVKLVLDSSLSHPQGYELSISADGITIRGIDATGVYYGVCTLRQLIQQYGATLPLLHIVDWPDFPVRGVMIDTSRDRMPKMETLYALIDKLASWKINQIQLYMEHSFAYSQHPSVWAQASPFTGQEVLEIDAYCRQRHIQLVPNQNSLGHMERWLKHPAYKHLAECPDGYIGNFGDHIGERRPATALSPLDPASVQHMAGLYNELLPYFGGEIFNIGGDEPWDLGMCASKEAVEQYGRGRVYVDYLLKIKQHVKEHGRTMMFWADVIMKYPELVTEMGQDVIALEWGYSADHPYSDHCPAFANSGIPFYVCPGTSSWNSLSGRTANAIGNLKDAAINGMQYGASGYLMTDWGDRGHWQPLPVSYLGFVYGAGISWAFDANENMDIPAVLDTFAFEDKAGIMGKLAYDLGNIYQAPGLAYPNGHLLFFVLQMQESDLRTFIKNLDEQVVINAKFGLLPESLQAVYDQIADIMQPIHQAQMQRPDAALIVDEFTQVADLLRHACQRGLLLSGAGQMTYPELFDDLEQLTIQQRLNWLARSRPGGLKDSLLRFEPVLREYRQQVGHLPSYL